MFFSSFLGMLSFYAYGLAVKFLKHKNHIGYAFFSCMQLLIAVTLATRFIDDFWSAMGILLAHFLVELLRSYVKEK